MAHGQGLTEEERLEGYRADPSLLKHGYDDELDAECRFLGSLLRGEVDPRISARVSTSLFCDSYHAGIFLFAMGLFNVFGQPGALDAESVEDMLKDHPDAGDAAGTAQGLIDSEPPSASEVELLFRRSQRIEKVLIEQLVAADRSPDDPVH